METKTFARVKALDLFAGTGWGVACQRLGIKEMGVEIMTEAVETRTANGMKTIYRDVWNGLNLTADQHRLMYGGYGLLIASPPCQTFSMAGNGAGRAALDEVIEAIQVHAYKDAQALKDFGDKHDPRTALVLTPLAYVWRDRPRLVALEQVPTVLPVWEACAEVMREWGYEVKVEILNAEQYGVPQTRKRAILVARRNGDVHLPVPTHSRYYSRTPSKLDPGVAKWVSMAEALGWDVAPGDVTVRTSMGTPKVDDRNGTHTLDPAIRPMHTLTSKSSSVTFTQNNRQAHQAVRTLDQPAPTVTAGHDSGNRGFIAGEEFMVATPEQVAALQSYPVAALKSMGSGMVERHGERPGRPADAPAFTVRASAGGTEPGGFIMDNGDGTTRKMDAEEAAILQSYPVFRNGNQANAAKRPVDHPAPTVHFGHRSNKVEWMDPALADDLAASGDRVTTEEAAALQTYPPFEWRGSKTKQFLQIGNAVPPLLAEAVLAALLGIRPGR